MKKTVYRTALAGILCALALALSFCENLIPALPFLPPGAKPGLSNIIVMFAAGNIGLPMALAITLVKGGFAFATRGATAALMSLAGGIGATIVSWLLLKYANKKLGLMGISVISALVHNSGQLLASIFITGSKMTAYYAPALAIFGVITGMLTGILLRAIMPALGSRVSIEH